MKKCSKCRQHKSLDEFAWQNKSKGYKVSWCKYCVRLKQSRYYNKNKTKICLDRQNKRLKNPDSFRFSSKKYYENHKAEIDDRNLINYHKKYRNSLNRRFQVYKARAKKINCDFDISKEKFDELTDLNCFYCGEKNELKANGLDRIDNNKGYTEYNVVPCCKDCNVAKHDMEQIKFKEKIIKIYNNWIKEKI